MFISRDEKLSVDRKGGGKENDANKNAVDLYRGGVGWSE